MPARILKESIRTSKTLAMLSDGAFRLWALALTTTDDFGLFEADAQIVRCNCFPRLLDSFSEERVDELLDELAAAGLVELYSANGRAYGRYLTFDKHNRLRAKHPKHPLPGESADICCHMTADADICCEKLPEAEAEAEVELHSEVEVEEKKSTKPRKRGVSLPLDHWSLAAVEAYHAARGSRPVNKQAEAAVLAALERTDGHPQELICAVLQWAATDVVDPPRNGWKGWARVVRSLASLRERKAAGYPRKFENVLEQYRDSQKRGNGRSEQTRYPSAPATANAERCACGHMRLYPWEPCEHCGAAPMRSL